MSAFAIGDRVQILAAGLQDRQGRITSEIGTGPDLRWQVHVDAAPFVADFLALIPEAELALIPPAPVVQDPPAVTLRAEPEAAEPETADPEPEPEAAPEAAPAPVSEWAKGFLRDALQGLIVGAVAAQSMRQFEAGPDPEADDPDDPDTIDAIHGEGFAEREDQRDRDFERYLIEIDRDDAGSGNWRLIEGALWFLHRRLQEAERTIASERQQRAIGETAQHRLAEQVHAFGLDQPAGGQSTARGLQLKLDALQASWDREHADRRTAEKIADERWVQLAKALNSNNKLMGQREALVDAMKRIKGIFQPADPELNQLLDYARIIREAESYGARIPETTAPLNVLGDTDHE